MHQPTNENRTSEENRSDLRIRYRHAERTNDRPFEMESQSLLISCENINTTFPALPWREGLEQRQCPESRDKKEPERGVCEEDEEEELLLHYCLQGAPLELLRDAQSTWVNNAKLIAVKSARLFNPQVQYAGAVSCLGKTFTSSATSLLQRLVVICR